MRVRSLPMIAILLATLLTLPSIVLSNQEVRITGGITGIDNRQETFLLREFGSGVQGQTWSVRVTSGTVGRRPGDRVATGAAATLRLLRVGDVVEVEGVVFAGNQLLARQVTVRVEAGTNTPGNVRGNVTLRGTIVNMASSVHGSFQIREASRFQGQVWNVHLHPQVRIEGQFDDRSNERFEGRGPQVTLRMLRVGDVIEVQGQVFAAQQVQAREIRLRSLAGGFPIPTPGPVPFPTQTVIISPREGEEIRSEEFSVIGQTVPGAQVRVVVSARVGLFQSQVASGTVNADHTGYFVFVARPRFRVPGSLYTITATPIIQGQSAPFVSVTVRQI